MDCTALTPSVSRLPVRRPLRLLSLALSLCSAAPGLVGAQVTYFHRPPTTDQLRAALLPPAQPTAMPPSLGSSSLPGGSRARGIQLQPQGAAIGDVPATGSATTAVPEAVGARAAALPINFDLGSSRVDRGSLPYIETVASLMRSDPGLKLIVEGHTDDRGSYNRNMVLSWDRALGVFRALVETYGVEPTRLQLVGKGPLEPMSGTEPRDGANRRVQFRIAG